MNLLKSAATALLLVLTTLVCAAPAAAQTVEYVHTDALGSVVAVTDANRNIVERREYEPYGYQLTPTLQNGPGYTGHVQDASTGLTYMQQRYYDPLLGRFLSVDPVTMHDNGDPRLFNRYGYANNNPYAFVDPDGRIAGAAVKFVRQTIKHKGNVIEAAVDIGGEVATVFAPSSTPMERLESAISLVSPVSVQDARKAKAFLEEAGASGRGRKGSIDTRAQNITLADGIEERGGRATTGGTPSVPETRFVGADGQVRYSDISARDSQGRQFEVQTVNVDRSGNITPDERSAAVDIAGAGDRPVICIAKNSCQ